MLPTALSISASIADSATTSGIIDLQERTPTHIVFPASFTGATVTFLACNNKAGTFVQLVKDEGTAISVTATDSKVVSLGAFRDHFVGLRYLKIVSASAESGAKDLTLYTIPLS